MSKEFPAVTMGVTIRCPSTVDHPYKKIKLVIPTQENKNSVLLTKRSGLCCVHNKETNKVEKLFSKSYERMFQHELLMNLIIKTSIQRDDLFLTSSGFDAENLCILFDYTELNTLSKFIVQQDIEYGTKIKLWNSLVEAVVILHENDIIHGDLHPDNIMIDTTKWVCKLLDFGNSGYKTNKNRIGSWIYQPHPSPDYLSKSLDIWSLGILYIYIFHYEGFKQILKQPNDRQHETFRLDGWVSNNIPAEIKSCVLLDESKRTNCVSLLFI